MNDLSVILKDLREQKGISQDRLAEDLSTTRSAIGNYETGRRTPNYEMLEKIADYYNVDMMYLLGKQEEKRRNTVIKYMTDVLFNEEYTESFLSWEKNHRQPAIHNENDLQLAVEIAARYLRATDKERKIINQILEYNEE